MKNPRFLTFVISHLSFIINNLTFRTNYLAVKVTRLWLSLKMKRFEMLNDK